MSRCNLTCIFYSLLVVPASAVIDWEGDSSKTASGLDTWVIAAAPHAATPPTIDGVISAGEWDAATRHPLPEVFHIADYAGVFEAQFAAQWDETYLYVLIEASDDVGLSERGHKFELYISTQYTREFGAWLMPGLKAGDYQVVCDIQPLDTFYTLGLYSDQTPLPSFHRANSVAGASYVSEVRIAWADLGGLPAGRGLPNADYIGFEVHTQRNAPAGAGGSQRTKRGWAGVRDTAWAATEDWGTLRLLPAGSGGGDPDPVSPWAAIEKIAGTDYKTTAIGVVHDDSFPYFYHAATGSWFYAATVGDALVAYSFAGDFYLWTSDAAGGYFFNLSDPSSGDRGWRAFSAGPLD
jgi:hypothetical protein